MSRPIKSTFSGAAAPTPRRASAALAALLLIAALAAPAEAASFDNGDFETGDFTGWTTAQANADGEWFVYSGTSAPLTGRVIPAPPQGAFAAVTDQADAGSQVLYRDLSLEPGFTGSLSFEWYYANRAGVFVTPASLDPAAGSNQQYRVDLVSPSASPFSMAPGDLIAPIVGTQVGDPASLAPTPVSFDLTPFAGTTVRLRFAAVETNGYFQAGVDAVAVSIPPSPPTPPDPPANTSPTSIAQCKNGGWHEKTDSQGHPFGNQGQCVSWVAAAGRSGPKS